jgi:Mannitol dehydrogenase Rossmann domain
VASHKTHTSVASPRLLTMGPITLDFWQRLIGKSPSGTCTHHLRLTQGLGNSTHVQESKAEGKVARIEYDRTKVTPGIVHFGVGGFHRGHQAVAIHRLLQQGLAMDWGICGVGVLEGDMKMRDVLDAQDGVFTVVEKSPDGSQTVQLIGSIVEYLYAPDSTEDVLARLADPATRIVSLTITEGGRVAD